MKKNLFIVLCLLVLVSVCCTVSFAMTADEAVTASKSLLTNKDKAEFLIGKAKDMYNSDMFQETINVAKYVLEYLDKDSMAAQELLANAKDKIAAMGMGSLQDAKSKIGSFGK